MRPISDAISWKKGIEKEENVTRTKMKIKESNKLSNDAKHFGLVFNCGRENDVKIEGRVSFCKCLTSKRNKQTLQFPSPFHFPSSGKCLRFISSRDDKTIKSFSIFDPGSLAYEKAFQFELINGFGGRVGKPTRSPFSDEREFASK